MLSGWNAGGFSVPAVGCNACDLEELELDINSRRSKAMNGLPGGSRD